MPNFYSDDLVSPSGLSNGRSRYTNFARDFNATRSNNVQEGNDDDVDVTEWVSRRAYIEEVREADDVQDEILEDNEDQYMNSADETYPNGDEDNEEIANQNTEKMYKDGIKKMDAEGLVDIGNLASWSVTSFKQGCGVSNLRDDSLFTYWQSDGQLPHALVIRFTKCVSIERISLFLNYLADESYTPSNITLFAGSGDHDLIEVLKVEMDSPVGWKHIKFTDSSKSGVLKCFILKLFFLSNHQNGKDTHLRSVKVMSPGSKTISAIDDFNGDTVGFTSLKFIKETVIR